MVVTIATGEIDDDRGEEHTETGKAGGKARAKSLSPDEREAIAKRVARVRWRKD